jgi:hypothetical protein
MAKSTKKTSAAPKTQAKPRKPAAKKQAARQKVTPISISRERVAELAYRYWNERGRAHGHHEEDWLRAEQELLGKAS